MIKIGVKAKGIRRARRAVRAFIRAIEDHEDIHQKMTQQFMLVHMRRRFASSGSYGGMAWQRLTGRYARFRKAITGNERPLEWDGENERLKPSLTQARHPDHIFNTRDASARFGTRVPYAARLESGGTDIFGDPYQGYDIINMTTRQRRAFVREFGKAVAQKAYRNTRGS
jgi:hypothetical protein